MSQYISIPDDKELERIAQSLSTSHLDDTWENWQYGPPSLLSRVFAKHYRCDLEAYRLLQRCSEAQDCLEWNKWRKKYPGENIYLQGADLRAGYYKGMNFSGINLEGASFIKAHCEGTKFKGAHCEGTNFREAHCEGAYFPDAHCKGGISAW